MVVVEASTQVVEQDLLSIEFQSVGDVYYAHVYTTVIADEADFVANVTVMSYDVVNDGVDIMLGDHDL